MCQLDCGGRVIDLARPQVMGILNVTPDSFSDGGCFSDPRTACAHAWAMVEAGADLIDVGGESTRPGADPVSPAEELERVIPVIAALAGSLSVPISVDTSKPRVMRAAVAAGAGLINDVCALRNPEALAVAVQLGVPVCLMHMAGEPRSMQAAPAYTNVVGEVYRFLAERIDQCVRAGLPRERLIIDPGFGFGKKLDHNLSLLAHLEVFTDLGVPILVGLSRKSMVGALTGRPPGERLAASLAAAVLALERGATILRVHDVAETRDAVAVWDAVRARGGADQRHDARRS